MAIIFSLIVIICLILLIFDIFLWWEKRKNIGKVETRNEKVVRDIMGTMGMMLVVIGIIYMILESISHEF